MRPKSLGDYARTILLKDQDRLWACAKELFYTRQGACTIALEAQWNAMQEEDRAVYAREAIALQREHAKTLDHIPCPTFRDRPPDTIRSVPLDPVLSIST